MGIPYDNFKKLYTNTYEKYSKILILFKSAI